MGCPAEVEIGDNLVFTVITHVPSTGAQSDADSVPTYRVYEDETGAAILNGSMALLDDANTLGFYSELIVCSSGNGFENGKSYSIYITVTVDSVVGGISYGFKAYDQRKASVAGAVGSVTGNVGGNVDGSVDSVTGDTKQTADNDTKLTAIETVLAGITSLAEWLGLLAGKQAGDGTALTEIKATGAGSGTFDEATDSQEANREVSDDIEAHVHNLSHGSAGISAAPKVSPNGFVITEGASEVNTEDSTHALDGTTHDIEDAGPNTDVYYEFLAGGPEGIPILVSWHGYVNANGATVAVFGYDFGNTAWVQIGSMDGNPGSTILTEDFTLTTNLVEGGVGTVRVRFFSTDATKIATDQILLEYTAVLSSSGIVDEWESQSQADPTGFHVNVLEIEGSDATDQIRDSVVDDSTRIDGSSVNAIEAKVDTAAGINTEARLAKLEGLPEEIAKNVALLNFPVVMVLTTDHITPATGKTVTAERYLDGATTGTAVGGSMTEAEFGLYHFDSAQADADGDIGTWRFSSTDCDDYFWSFRTVS